MISLPPGLTHGQRLMLDLRGARRVALGRMTHVTQDGTPLDSVYTMCACVRDAPTS